MKKLVFFFGLFFCLSMVHAQTNLLSSMNGDFENGNLNDWNLDVRSSPTLTAECTASISSDAHTGTAAALVTWPTLTDGDDQVFIQHPVVFGGQKLSYKAWAKSLSGPIILRMHCTFFDGSGAVLSDLADVSWTLSDVYTEHTWTLPDVPQGTTYTNIGFRVLGADGSRFPHSTVSCIIDDVQLIEKPIAYSADLLSGLNGDFETGNLIPWELYVRSANTSQCSAEISSDSHDGSNAAQVDWGALDAGANDDQWFNQHPNAVPGQKLTFKAWAKSLSGPLMLRLHCTFFDGTGAVISDLSDESWILSDVYSQHAWVLPVVPEGTVTTNIGFRVMGWDGQVASRFPSSAVSCLIDNVRLLEEAPPVYSTNLLTDLNGDFEKGNIDNWRYVNVMSGAVNILTGTMSSDSHGGSYAAQVTWPLVDPTLQEILIDQNLPATEGEQYIYKAWAKLQSGSPIILRIHCTFWTAQNTVAGDYNDQTWILDYTYAEHEWIVPVAPPGTATINIGFRAYNADGSRWPVDEVVSLIDDVQLYKEVTTSISSITATSKTHIYPNPATDRLSVVSDKLIKNISIYNMAGQKVIESFNNFNAIDVADLHSGIYIVKTITEGGESTQKLAIK